ncbi:MAG: hypothetical protein ACREMD_03025 [Gemmatimonadota bacterium]
MTIGIDRDHEHDARRSHRVIAVCFDAHLIHPHERIGRPHQRPRHQAPFPAQQGLELLVRQLKFDLGDRSSGLDGGVS